MKVLSRIFPRRGFRQRGATAVEFALVSAVFFTILFGIMEMARMLYYWNSAAEATRLGARLAVVCDLNDADIKAHMQQMLAIAATANISINYLPASCTVDTCESVTVSLSNISVTTAIPFVPLTLTVPPFSTTLPRESMRSTVNGQANPVCG
jgi:Flp pilus assembly protein TadG